MEPQSYEPARNTTRDPENLFGQVLLPMSMKNPAAYVALKAPLEYPQARLEGKQHANKKLLFEVR